MIRKFTRNLEEMLKTHLKKIKKKNIRKLRNRGGVSHETIDSLNINNPKLGRFYLLPKIHKRLHVPGRPVISNPGFTQKIFLPLLSIILKLNSHLPKKIFY